MDPMPVNSPLELVTEPPMSRDRVVLVSLLGFVAAAFRRHAELLVDFLEDEARGCRDIRKHVAWYFKGYAVGGETRAALAQASSLAEIDDLQGRLDADQPYPGADAEGQRGRAGTPKRPALPDRWLDSRELQETHRAELTEYPCRERELFSRLSGTIVS